ncbi:MAG TPA: hypothetical protein VFB52_14510 [Solirubrobacterales bacterium]|nr:hypothetical protein [Solirubrobacterales bacterium]
MHTQSRTAPSRSITSFKALVAALLALAALAGAFGAEAQAAGGPGRIVFVAGKAERCKGDACNRFDEVRSISPHGRGGQRLALISSVSEIASTERGTLAVVSRNVAGGGANSEVFTQIYMLTPGGKRTAVFDDRIEGFNPRGLGISGNGRLLVVAARYEAETGTGRSKLFVVRPDGSGMRQLTDGRDNDEMPALSPDGKRVVFSRTVDGKRNPDLYVVPVSGGEPVQLTDSGLAEINPVWSPDGRRIAFGQANMRANRGTIAVARADGSGVRTLTATGSEWPDPDFSPNGRSLVFVGELPGRGYDTALYTVRTSGGGRTIASRAYEYPELAQWTLRP